MMRTITLLMAFELIAILGGCASTPTLQHDRETICEHVIAVDGRGRPHDPMSPSGPAYTMAQYRQQIRCIVKAIEVYQDDPQHHDGKILIFVHGGLNSPEYSLAAADSEMDCVMDAGYYPIYLDWNSDWASTYGAHIVSITQGETENNLGRMLLAPAYVLADFGRAICRTPIVWINQFGSDIESIGSDIGALPKKRELESTTRPDATSQDQRWATRSQRGQALSRAYDQLRWAQKNDGSGPNRKQLRVYIGPDFDVDPWHMADLAAWYVLTLPTKLVTEPIIDWLGTPAWRVMSGRTLIAFDGDLGENPNNPELKAAELGMRGTRGMKASDFSTVGAMEVFREELQYALGDGRAPTATRPAGRAFDITLVGHSMGTMILNEWLRRDIEEGKGNLYSNIVYMAAACSVRDFSRSVVPFLIQHRSTQFYDLMLHPLADLRERGTLYDLLPRGSLLVWLDDFLTDPQTPLDRTLGRWDNLINATEVIPESAKKQVTLKAFPLAPSDQLPPPPGQLNLGPQQHGQFRDSPYWRPHFWEDQLPVVCMPICPKIIHASASTQCCQ